VAGSCQPQRGVPIITFHGTDDSVNPFDGVGAAYWGYGVPVALQRWSEFNHCSGTRQHRRIAPHVVEERYDSCQHHADIVLYRTEASAAEGGGHVWPGGAWPPAAGGRPEISASERIWEFFRRHPL
jgi:polyhydroxybutyrate depolymerase